MHIDLACVLSLCFFCLNPFPDCSLSSLVITTPGRWRVYARGQKRRQNKVNNAHTRVSVQHPVETMHREQRNTGRYMIHVSFGSASCDVCNATLQSISGEKECDYAHCSKEIQITSQEQVRLTFSLHQFIIMLLCCNDFV